MLLATEHLFGSVLTFFLVYEISEDMSLLQYNVLCVMFGERLRYYFPVCAMCMYPSFCTVHEAVGCFCVPGTVNNVAVSIGVQVS